jgi:phage shock protein E
MNPQQFESFGIPLIVIGFFVWRMLRFRRIKSKLPAIREKGGVVVDVRSRGEFLSGSSPGSVNIPLDELPGSIGQFSIDQPIILCCASGTRSGMALSLFKQRGFKNVVNAGPWKNTV